MNELLLPLILFSFSMCATPGPNNMMLTASGANFGFRRTIPHLLGIEFGMLFMLLACAFGLGVLFETFPLFQKLLKILCLCYLFYLSYKIALSSRGKVTNKEAKPLRLYQAALFQLVNPKAVIMAVSVMTSFTLAGSQYYQSVLLILIVFGLTCILSISLWAGFGTVIGRFLKSDKSFRVFNVAMGLLTASSALLVL